MPAYVLDAAKCLRERGFSFVTGIGAAFSARFTTQPGLAAELAKVNPVEIGGRMNQWTMPEDKPRSVWRQSGLRDEWHALVKELAARVGVAAKDLRLHVQDAKLLTATMGVGEQAPYALYQPPRAAGSNRRR